jgi:hypothetical protein
MSSRTPGGTRTPRWIPLLYVTGKIDSVTAKKVYVPSVLFVSQIAEHRTRMV